jgi:hypothetical protein
MADDRKNGGTNGGGAMKPSAKPIIFISYSHKAHESPHFRRTRKRLNLGLPGRLDGATAG